jgi:hypothetical protein
MVLACGAVCQPTEIQREIEAFPSSTRTVRVATDAGDGFLKAVGNPMGTAVLVSELVGGELGTWFGLALPPFAVVHHCDLQIIMPNIGVMNPPMFFSAAVDGEPHAGDTFSAKLAHPGHAARLAVFDTWIRNCDRSADNLLYVKRPGRSLRYEIVPIDHGECFHGPEGTDFPVGAWPEDRVNDPKVYCQFLDDFGPQLTAAHVADAVGRLATLERAFVDEVVQSVPAAWGLGPVAAGSLADFICRRAEYVVNTISPMLVADPEIPGLANG